MGKIGPLVVEASPFGSHSDTIGESYWIAVVAGLRVSGSRFQPFFHFTNSPGKGGGVAAVKDKGIEAVQREILHKPSRATLLRQGGALVNTASVINHNRCYQATIIGTPPARGPVTPTLLLKGAVTQEGHQSFTGQGHMDILQLDEAEISPFGQPSGCIGIDMTAQG